MDYMIKSHEEFIRRVHEYFTLMNQVKFVQQKPRPDQQDFWYHYGKVKDSIKQYAKHHS